MSKAKLPGTLDRFWVDATAYLESLVNPGDLLLAPAEFLSVFPGTIALHVRKRMLEDVVITHYVLHKGLLDRIDPAFLLEATMTTPVFANEVFAIYSWRGDRLPNDQVHHLSPVENHVAGIQLNPSINYNTAVVVTTYNRPRSLRRTLGSLARQGSPIVTVDDGSSFFSRILNRLTTRTYGVTYVHCPVNLGLANSINIGVSHWLAHPEVEWISVFNDDVEVVDGFFNIFEAVLRQSNFSHADVLYTGYFDIHHAVESGFSIAGRPAFLARSCSAKHLLAHRSYWQSVLPIPTAYVGAPKKTGGLFPGQGSDADWWIASFAPRAAPKRGGHVVVIPDMVSTFAADAAMSTWGNQN